MRAPLENSFPAFEDIFFIDEFESVMKELRCRDGARNSFLAALPESFLDIREILRPQSEISTSVIENERKQRVIPTVRETGDDHHPTSK